MASSNSDSQRTEIAGFETLPGSVPDGSAFLVAKPAPLTEYGLTLRITDHFASPEDCRLAVTTRVDAERTIRQQEDISSRDEAYRLGIVDASASQRPSAPFQEYPIVSLPQPGELTRVVLSLWELDKNLSKSCDRIHIVLRSITPMLEEVGIDPVLRVLEQLIDQQRTKSGLVVFSVEYTNFDEETMRALSSPVDGIIWTEASSKHPLRLSFQSV